MKQSSITLTKTETEFLKSLMKGGFKSDSEIAREIKASKASISRIKKKLRKDKILLDFTPIVDFEKIGIKLFAMVSFEWTNFKSEKVTKQMENWVESRPNTILLAEGESVEGLNYLVYLGFKDLEDYHMYFKEFRREFGTYIKQVHAFFIPITKILLHDYGKLVIHALNELALEGSKK